MMQLSSFCFLGEACSISSGYRLSIAWWFVKKTGCSEDWLFRRDSEVAQNLLRSCKYSATTVAAVAAAEAADVLRI